MNNWLKLIGFSEKNNIFEKNNVIVWSVNNTNTSNEYYETYLHYLSLNKHLIIIFKDENEKRKEQYKNYIKSILGIYQKKVYARQCEIREIGKHFARDFVESNHIQGSNNLGIIFYGLFYNDALIGVISLGRHHRSVKYSDEFLVLDRLCFKDGVQVVGGASRLFSACIKWANERKYKNIISFSDNRWSLGKIYTILGFNLEKEYKPDYFYVDKKSNRLSKQSQKKNTVGCPEGMTEYEWARKRELIRIWDCGKKKWNYRLKPSDMTYKEMLSRKCSLQHANGIFKHSHLRGYFYSQKNNKHIYYSSSYELRCLYMLEHDNNIKSFDRCHIIPSQNGKFRNPDIKVEYVDNSLGIIEVKPLSRCNGEEEIKQINESKNYAELNNYSYKTWTELDSGLNSDKEIIAWAKENSEDGANFDFISKQKHNERQQKYYNEKIKDNKVETWCDYCQKNHSVLKNSYNKNIERNGKYICEKEGGHIAGSKPKLHLRKENMYATEGKKQCIGENCNKSIKPFSEFNKDKHRKDGYSTRCRDCLKKAQNENYLKRKNINLEEIKCNNKSIE